MHGFNNERLGRVVAEQKPIRDDTCGNGENISEQYRIAITADISGLATGKWIAAYVYSIRLWFGLSNGPRAKMRVDALGEVIGNLAIGVGIPVPVIHVAGNDAPTAERTFLGNCENAVFSRRRWSVVIRTSSLDSEFNTDPSAARFAAMLYHELRHGEQTFRAARAMAAKLMSNIAHSKIRGREERVVALLKARLGVPELIARAALANLLPAADAHEHDDVNAVDGEAARWAAELWADRDGQSVASRVRGELVEQFRRYTVEGAAFAQAYRDYEGAHASERARCRTRIVQQWQALVRTEGGLKCAFDAYAALAVEQDAWYVGGQVERLLNPSGPVRSVAQEWEKIDATRVRLEARLNNVCDGGAVR